MRGYTTSAVAASMLLVRASAQDSYCDNLGRCFVSFSDSASGITYGIALPEVTEAPFDVIVQITAPTSVGWAGLAWGGTMANNPLSLVWSNGAGVTASSRIAYGYTVPASYAGATYSMLPGSYTNETHHVTTFLCEGCSAWDEAVSASLDPSGENYLAYAWSMTPPEEPENAESFFGVHDAHGGSNINLSAAQHPDFDLWAAEADEPPTSTTTEAETTPTEPPTSTQSSPAEEPTDAPAFPSDCGLQSAFPLEVADGWRWTKIAGGLRAPRGMALDANGNLLIIDSGVGLVALSIGPDGCVSSQKTIISRPQLNHGIALTPDGKTLTVSSSSTAWRYAYDAAAQAVTNEEVVVQGMYPGGHVTRTLVIPPATPNLLVVSLGSLGNLDGPSLDKNTGRAIVKTFDLNDVPSGGYNYNTQGNFLGYGLRNEVAIAIDPNNHAWGVENSADEFARTVDGVETDIHENNPAEELNYLGDPSVSNEKWYGYPTCFTVWGSAEFPDGDPAPGSQFIPAPNATFNDATCEELSTPPRLSLQAHAAPIDAKFDQSGDNLFVSLHGSWNRDVPYGYKVVTIPFTTGEDGNYEPVAAPDSTEGYDDILWDPQEGCSSTTCFRPSGIVWDQSFSRMYVGSDNSRQGEVYILARTV